MVLLLDLMFNVLIFNYSQKQCMRAKKTCFFKYKRELIFAEAALVGMEKNRKPIFAP